MGITNITSAILNSVGLEVKSFVNYLCGGIFMFACILFLPKYVGINALIIGMGISSIISAFLNILMLKRKMKIKIEIVKNLLKMIAFSLPTIAITSFVSSLFSYVFPLFVDMVLSCIVGVVFFVALCLCFNVIG